MKKFLIVKRKLKLIMIRKLQLKFKNILTIILLILIIKLHLLNSFYHLRQLLLL
eukprot:jgi/Orpsp1_1/1186713/evm.model.d7180000052726.1